MSSLRYVLNIRHPIAESGRERVAGPELSTEVSRAGGLGILLELTVSPDALRAQNRPLAHVVR